MTALVLAKLGAIFATIAAGWIVGRGPWLLRLGGTEAVAARLSQFAFVVIVPALLFRTMARTDFATLPLRVVAAFLVPLAAAAVVVRAWQRLRGEAGAAPATRATTVCYGNAVQMGIPLAAAVFGEAGLALHLAVVSLHGLTLLTVLTALVESDLARSGPPRSRAATLGATARNTVIHPVVLPVLAGAAWQLLGLPIPEPADQVLRLLGALVAPVCLVLIGLSLALFGLKDQWRGAVPLVLVKLFVLPALVWLVARWGFGLEGLPLAVLVMFAALPVGSNALIFAQRYRALQGETTAAIVVSTVAFAATAPLWLALLALLEPWTG